MGGFTGMGYEGGGSNFAFILFLILILLFFGDNFFGYSAKD